MKLKLPGLDRLPALLERFKYPILILLVGLALLLWPSGKRDQAEVPAPEPAASETEADDGQAYCRKLEQQLEAILGQVEGAGRVKVLLTLKTGPAAAYQTDLSTGQSKRGEEENLSREEKTVILQRGSAYDEPAVVSTAYPVFQGALILAEGGGDPNIRYQLSASVGALLGLGADQITVVKMKEREWE